MGGHVARLRERRGVYRIWCGNLRERDHLEDPGLDEMDLQGVGCGVWIG